MSTAVPMSLEPEQLKGWLKDKKAAQQKLAKELRSMAITLGRGKMTIAEYLDKSGYSTQSKDNESDVVDWNDL
jgi:trehalose-6-phosphate synthase